MRISRKSPLYALGLASLLALAGCDPRDIGAFFLILVLYAFAAANTGVSLIGTVFAVVRMARRRPRSFINLGLSVPFAAVAIAVHVFATDGFTYVGDDAFMRVSKYSPSSSTSYSHPTMGWLLVFVGSPLIWSAVAAIEAALAPLPGSESPTPPLRVDRIMMAVIPTVLALAGYTSIFFIASSTKRPVVVRPPSKEVETAVSAARERASAWAKIPSPPVIPGFPQPTTEHSPFELMWTASTGRWNEQISFAPTGEVLAADGSTLQVLDATTGRTLHNVPSCLSAHGGGFGWLDERHAALVCQDEIRGYELPKLLHRTLVDRKTFSLAGAAVHPKLIIASDADEILAKKARVRLFDPHTHHRLAELAIPADSVEGVAIAPNGVLFALGFEGSIEFREAPSGSLADRMDAAKSRVLALSFSQDGKLLVANDDSFVASVIDVATKRRIRTYQVGSWLTQTAWLHDGTIVATGSDGLFAFFPDGSQALVGGFSGQGVAVSADGTMVCAGDNDGKIRMYRLKRVDH